jgi:transposase-like protein
MAKRSVRYTPEFKRQMVDLVRSGRNAASLAKEFGPSAWTSRCWLSRTPGITVRAMAVQPRASARPLAGQTALRCKIDESRKTRDWI